MKNSNASKPILLALVLMSSALAAYAQPPQPPKRSAESSPKSDTRAVKPSAVGSQQSENSSLVNACNAAVDELGASRVLIEALENENAALRERLETEKRAAALLTELNDTRRAENEALKTAIAAKNETIAAKDAATTAQEKLIEQLKTKKRSPWSRIADILLGAGAALVLK